MLRWVEGFEGFGGIGTISANNDISRKYLTYRVEGLGTLVQGRAGAGTFAWNTNTTGNPYIQTPALNTAAAIDTIIIGFAWKCDVLPIADTNILYFIEEYIDFGINVQITSGGEIVVERRGSELGRSTTAGLSTETWYYIEIKIFLDNSAGTVDVKVDENSVLSLTSKDTLQGALADVAAVRFYGTTDATYNFTYDDIYICDDAGSVNNNFLGVCMVSGIFPNSAGDETDFTPSAGSNYECVDEVVSDDDTSYVESSTSTDRDLYNYESMPGSLGDILGVQINTTVRETDVNIFTLKQPCKSSTTVSAGSAEPVGSTTYTHRERILEQDPHTSAAWIEAGVNAAQFGVEVG